MQINGDKSLRRTAGDSLLARDCFGAAAGFAVADRSSELGDVGEAAAGGAETGEGAGLGEEAEAGDAGVMCSWLGEATAFSFCKDRAAGFGEELTGGSLARGLVVFFCFLAFDIDGGPASASQRRNN